MLTDREENNAIAMIAVENAFLISILALNVKLCTNYPNKVFAFIDLVGGRLLKLHLSR